MTENALDLFVHRTRASWGPLSSDLVASCRDHLEQLVKAHASEPWLAALHEEAPASRELYRDAEHGFVLQAHTEQADGEEVGGSSVEHVLASMRRGAARVTSTEPLGQNWK